MLQLPLASSSRRSTISCAPTIGTAPSDDRSSTTIAAIVAITGVHRRLLIPFLICQRKTCK
jgi:hypothetical protein